MELDVKEVEAVQVVVNGLNEAAAKTLNDLGAVCLGGGLGETCL